MHELSIINALIKSVEEYQRAEQENQVKSLRIEVGNMTCVDSARLLFCFDMVKQDAGLSDVDLCIEPVQAIALCQSCGDQFEILRVGESCKCGSYKHDLLSGNELNLTEIEFV
jgi:hydrogenase nickel incorporation protein HypA/HybF